MAKDKKTFGTTGNTLSHALDTISKLPSNPPNPKRPVHSDTTTPQGNVYMTMEVTLSYKVTIPMVPGQVMCGGRLEQICGEAVADVIRSNDGRIEPKSVESVRVLEMRNQHDTLVLSLRPTTPHED